MLLVDVTHLHRCWRQFIVDENENRRVRTQLDALANHVDELTDRQIGRDEILFLVNVSDRRLFALLCDDRNSVRVLEANSGALSLALL